MKNLLPALVAGLGLAGLLSGYLGGRLVKATPVSTPLPGKKADPVEVASPPATRSALRSTDTLEDLSALGDEVVFSRLALWLMDAAIEDLAVYWEQHKARTDRKREITEAVMIFWARLNPQGALAAVAGTDEEPLAW